MQENLFPLYVRSSDSALNLISPKQEAPLAFVFSTSRNSDANQSMGRSSAESINRSSLENIRNYSLRLPISEKMTDLFNYDSQAFNLPNDSFCIHSSSGSARMEDNNGQTEVTRLLISLSSSEENPNRGSKSLFNDEESPFYRVSNMSNRMENATGQGMQDIDTTKGIVIEPTATEPAIIEPQFRLSRISIASEATRNYTPDGTKLFEMAAPEPIKEETKAIPTSSQYSEESEQRPSCNCKKSMCLKLYCECFAASQYCTNCNCVECYNQEEYEAERLAAIAKIVRKNPDGYNRRMALIEDPNVTDKNGSTGTGCNCSKSGCRKNYCECYKLGVICGETCSCADCKNKRPRKTKPKKK